MGYNRIPRKYYILFKSLFLSRVAEYIYIEVVDHDSIRSEKSNVLQKQDLEENKRND